MAGLGDLERSVMRVLWDSGEPMSVRQVHGVLATERDLAYTTVMTVLVRLVDKGMAERELDGRAWHYRAARSSEELTAEAMHTALGDGGADRSAALVAFVEKVSADEAALLRQALGTLEGGTGTSRGGRKRRSRS